MQVLDLSFSPHWLALSINETDCGLHPSIISSISGKEYFLPVYPNLQPLEILSEMFLQNIAAVHIRFKSSIRQYIRSDEAPGTAILASLNFPSH